MVRSTGESIGTALKELHPADLASCQFRLREEMAQGVMVGVDLKMGSIQIISPSLEGADDNVLFLFMSGIISVQRN